MKKSVIFWNIVAVITYFVLLLSTTGGCHCITLLLMVLSTAIGMVACLHSMIDHKASLWDVKKLKKQGFIHWWVYVTPSGLMFLLATAIIIGVHNFNEWINRK